jgi:hypothetical protein
MSLVVAQTIGAGPYIVSDTCVTDPHGRPLPTPKDGTLKAVVVSRDVAICFAGDVKTGTEAVRSFGRAISAGTDVDELLTVLAGVTSTEDVEFLVAKNQPGASLVRIRCGEVGPGAATAWLGDHAAFERFQEERMRSSQGPAIPATPGQRLKHDMETAMRAVIEDATISSVGGFVAKIGRYQDSLAFNYHAEGFAHVGRNFRFEGELTVQQLIRPVEEGGYSYCVVEPASSGIPALGLIFLEANLAMAFLPLQFDGVQVVPDVHVDDFVEIMEDRFGVRFAEPLLSAKGKAPKEGILIEGLLVPWAGDGQ